MRRRDVLANAGGVAAWPLASCAQEAKSAPRIGVLITSNPDAVMPLFREGLSALGYIEGTNIQLEVRSGDAKPELLAAQAKDLVAMKVDILVGITTPAAHAAKNAAARIPVVIAAGDAVGTGLVASLARPGGNVTGISSIVAELGGKLLQLIREAIPEVRRVAVLANVADPFTRPFLAQLQEARRKMGLAVQVHMLRSGDPYGPVFAQMAREKADAVIVQPSLLRIPAADQALKSRLPAFSPHNAFTAERGLMAYAPDIGETYRALAGCVDKVRRKAPGRPISRYSSRPSSNSL